MSQGDLETQLLEIANSLEFADSQFQLGNYDTAEPIYGRAFGFLESHFGVKDPDTISCLQKLLETYIRMGYYRDALLLYRQQVKIGEQVLGRDHPDVRSISSKIASVDEQLQEQVVLALFEESQHLSRTAISALKRPTKEIADPLLVGAAAPVKREKLRQDAPPQPPSRPSAKESKQPGKAKPDKAKSKPDQKGESKDKKASGTKNKVPEADRLGRVIDPKRLPGNLLEQVQEFEEADLEEPKKIPTWKERRRPGRPDPNELGRTRNMRDRFIALAIANSSAISAAISLVLFIGFGTFLFNKIEHEQARLNKIPSFKTKFNTFRYNTTDGIITLSLTSQDQAQLAVKGKGSIKIPYCRIGTDWKELFGQALNSLQHKELWFLVTPQGLTDESGVIYYLHDAPEQTVVANMHKVEDQAVYCYRVRGIYPEERGVFINTQMINPCNGKIVLPDIHTLNTLDPHSVIAGASIGNDIYQALEEPATGLWQTEQTAIPGAVHYLALKNTSSNPPQSEFYLHGFDRNGSLLTSSRPGKVFLIAYKNGQSLNQSETGTMPESRRSLRVCLVQAPWPSPWFTARSLHYMLPLCLFAFTMIIFLGGQLGKPKDQMALHFTPVDILSVVLLVVSMAWGIWYAMP